MKARPTRPQEMIHAYRGVRRKILLLRVHPFIVALVLLAFVGCGSVIGQENSQDKPAASPAETGLPQAKQGEAQPLSIPSFWDPRRRPERPDTSRITLIRFLAENDYPPFNYAGADGNPAGFNVDLARMVCEELKIACTVQMRRFDTLVEALSKDGGDAVIASIAINDETRKRFDFSDPYFRTPARFVARRDVELDDMTPETLEGRSIAVVGGTAHEAYLKALFTGSEIKPYPDSRAAADALRKSEADVLFGDGVTLAFWINGTESKGCCAFRGGPFTESRYFGEGVGIAVRKGNDTLRRAFDWALFRLWENGRYNDLLLRYFPVSPF